MATYKKTAPKPKTSGLGANAFKGFTPYVPPPPPTGSYDPALNAAQGASQRGLGDFRQDTATANLRAGVDYGLDTDDITRSRDRGFFDIDRDYGRGTSDLDLSRSRGIEDYGTQIKGLERSYQQLQRRQGEGARAAGVLSGGIALQAAAKRAENMAIDRQPMDTNQNRFLTDNTTDRTRLTEDYGTNRGRIGEDATLAQGRLDIGYQRGGIDRGTALGRAEREGVEFGLDIGEQKAFQSSQSGYVPPTGPKNQGVTAAGVQYVERNEGNYIVRYDPQGRVLSRRLKPGTYGTVRPGSMGLGG